MPEVNAGSMADISFLLLIFFLVATTMNVDSGIMRQLPPINDDTEGIDVHKRNILEIRVNAADMLLVGGERVDITQLKDIAKNFLTNPTNAADLPEKEAVEIELLGMYPRSKGVLSLQNEVSTSYKMYIMVQNELTRAVNELREELSEAKFGKPFAGLEGKQKDAIQTAIPNKISEAEPRDMTGGGR